MDAKEFLDLCFEIAKQTGLRGFVFDGLHADGTCDSLVCHLFFGESGLTAKQLNPIVHFDLNYEVVSANKFTCSLQDSAPVFCNYVVTVYHPNYLPF